MEGIPWFHSFELLPGIVTPGRAPCNPKLGFDHWYKLPASLSGLRALDIGTWDGPWAFELERRGAEVVALDIQDPNSTGFNAAKEILNSKVNYIQAGVYELSRVLSGKFDIICFFGVYYHLKCPVLAFEELHKVLADEGRILIEGECLRNWAPTPGEAAGTDNPVGHKDRRDAPLKSIEQRQPGSLFTLASRVINKVQRMGRRVTIRPSRFAMTLAQSDVPITLFYAGAYKQDASNWFIPNFACIREWLSAAALQLISHDFEDASIPCQRFRGIAQKVTDGKIIVEHPLVTKGGASLDA
jgi:SAM-dependent methyltransferase